MEHKMGLKYGLDPEKGFHILIALIPGLALITGGLGISIWSVCDYFDMVDFGMYDEEFMIKQLISGLITGGILLLIGSILLIFLMTARHNYKTGYWDVYGFTYNDVTKKLQIHRTHKKREVYIGDIVDIRIRNRGLDYRGNYDPSFAGRITPWGFIKICVEKNGKRRWYSPYGMVWHVAEIRDELYRLISELRDIESIYSF